MNRNAILYFFSFIAISSIIFVLVMELALKKWKCTDQKKCVRVLGGDYDSEGKCRDSCSRLGKNTSVPKLDTYDCVNNTCRKAQGDQGLYNNISECEDKCKSKTEIIVHKPYYTYGYPYYYRYPYHWRSRRFRRRSPRFRRRSPRSGRPKSVRSTT